MWDTINVNSVSQILAWVVLIPSNLEKQYIHM